MNTASNYHLVRQRIVRAARKVNRDPASVTLVAVAKSGTLGQIVELIKLGHRDFGESRVQQLQQRITELPAALAAENLDPAIAGDIRWHMIGHLQRNKAGAAMEASWLIHGVDSMRLAEELESLGQRHQKRISALLEVNTSGEESKFGVRLPAARHLFEQFRGMSALNLVGLMTMAPQDVQAEHARPSFVILRELFDEIQLQSDPSPDFKHMSMGMSGDFEVAIEEGATLVRVGSAIFNSPAPQPLGAAASHR